VFGLQTLQKFRNFPFKFIGDPGWNLGLTFLIPSWPKTLMSQRWQFMKCQHLILIQLAGADCRHAAFTPRNRQTFPKGRGSALRETKLYKNA